jgi:hypothetical protein
MEQEKKDKKLATVRLGVFALAVVAGAIAYTPNATAQSTCQNQCSPGSSPCAIIGSALCLRS